MKKISRLAALLLAGMMAVSMTACSGEPAQEESSAAPASDAGSSTAEEVSEEGGDAASGYLEQIQERGYITMSTNAEFPPFEYMEGTEYRGIDVDISQKIADKLGVELRINNTSFDSLPLELETDKCDFVAAGMTIDPEKDIDFTNPYFNASQVIIVQTGSDITSGEDLDGKRIGVQLGTTGDTYCTENYPNAQISRMSKAMDAVADLARGNLDAVVVDDYPAKMLAAQNPDAVVVLEEALTVEEYGLAVKKGNQEMLDLLNETLAELEESGELDEIFAAYLSEEE